MKQAIRRGPKSSALVLSSLLFAAAVAASPAAAQAARGGEAVPSDAAVYVIPIQGDIEPSTAVFVQRRIKSALSAGAETLVFTIDTFGGRVDSALRIAAAVGAVRDARTVAFVGGGEGSLGVSWSAGALIAMSAKAIYMAPGTSIGAAAPVVATPEGGMEGAGEKTVSAVRAQMAALAEKNGYPPGIALAMVDADVELVELILDGKPLALTAEEAAALKRERGAAAELGRTLSAKGKLLSLTAGEAERYGLSSGTVGGLDGLAVALAGEGAKWLALEPSLADDVVVFLSSAAVQSILILIGLVALFIEINSPGFGIPGTVAIVAFVLLFGSSMLMGTVGSLELVLFLVGMGLLVVEIFVLPGFGVAGISGLALIAGALVLSMQDFVLPQGEYQWDIFARNAATVGSGVLLGIIGIGALIVLSPRLRLFSRLALNTAITGTASGAPAPEAGDPGLPPSPRRLKRSGGAESTSLAGTEGAASIGAKAEEPYWPAVGEEGVAETTLRPVGRARFGSRSTVVEAEGRFVEAGSRLRVAALRGGSVYVEPVEGPGA